MDGETVFTLIKTPMKLAEVREPSIHIEGMCYDIDSGYCARRVCEDIPSLHVHGRDAPGLPLHAGSVCKAASKVFDVTAKRKPG